MIETLHAAKKNSIAIIAILRGRDQAERLAASLRRQTCSPDRIVLVLADENADAVAAQLRPSLSDYVSGVETSLCIQASAAGRAACWNAGLALAGDCEYVCFLAPGYVPDAFFLDRSAACLNGKPSAVAAVADLVHEYQERQKLLSAAGITEDCAALILHRAGELISCSLLRSSVVRSFNAFNVAAGYGAQLEFCLQLLAQGEWLYAADCAVWLRGEQGLSADLPAQHAMEYALLCEMYIDSLDLGDRFRARSRRRILAQQWYYAAYAMFAVGRLQEARQCLRRSLIWRALINPALLACLCPPRLSASCMRFLGVSSATSGSVLSVTRDF